MASDAQTTDLETILCFVWYTLGYFWLKSQLGVRSFVHGDMDNRVFGGGDENSTSCYKHLHIWNVYILTLFLTPPNDTYSIHGLSLMF